MVWNSVLDTQDISRYKGVLLEQNSVFGRMWPDVSHTNTCWFLLCKREADVSCLNNTFAYKSSVSPNIHDLRVPLDKMVERERSRLRTPVLGRQQRSEVDGIFQRYPSPFDNMLERET